MMRRRMMMVKGGLLPQGYTQLDYVSNGGQVCYIDTGIPVSDVSFHIRIFMLYLIQIKRLTYLATLVRINEYI